MKNNAETNAITQRLDLLRAAYKDFHQHDTFLLCHWLAKPDELQMIDAFVQYENSEIGIIPDFFITFTTPFRNAADYGQALLNELHQYFGKNGDLLKESEMPADFPIPQHATQPYTVFTPLSDFARRAAPLKNAVAFLKPVEISSFEKWEAWIAGALENGVPPQVKLMLALPEEAYPFYTLRQQYKTKVATLIPNLNMQDAMRQLASAGNPQDPAVQFRLLYLEMGQAAGAKDFDRLRKAGQKALNLTQQQKDWEQMEFTVRAAMGSHLLPYKELQAEAINEYVQGTLIADRMLKTQHPLGEPVFVQSRMFKGAGLINTGRYPEAAAAYEEILPRIATDDKQTFQYMEACRLAGQSRQLAGENMPAWTHYQNALQAAERLGPEQRYETLILYIGAALLQLCTKTNNDRQEPEIRSKLTQLIGPDWEDQMHRQKIKA